MPGREGVGTVFNGDRVSVWEDEEVLEVMVGVATHDMNSLILLNLGICSPPGGSPHCLGGSKGWGTLASGSKELRVSVHSASFWGTRLVSPGLCTSPGWHPVGLRVRGRAARLKPALLPAEPGTSRLAPSPSILKGQ